MPEGQRVDVTDETRRYDKISIVTCVMDSGGTATGILFQDTKGELPDALAELPFDSIEGFTTKLREMYYEIVEMN